MNDREPESVEEVNYSRKNLTRIPEEIQQFPNLLRLDLSYNTIFRIENFQNFRLDKLKFSHNRIVRLENLYSLKSLRTLDVSYNYISIAVLRGLSNLRVLILKRNSFFDLPDLGDLTNLRVLDCSFNKLSSLPDLSSLHNLKILRVNNNLIEEIPQLPDSVEMFNIGSNRIHFFLGIRVLGNCKRLHNLVICNNPFSASFFQNGINYRPFVVSFFRQNVLKELDVESIREEDREIDPNHIEIFHDSDDDTEFINQLHRSLLLGLKKKKQQQQQKLLQSSSSKKKKKKNNRILLEQPQSSFNPSPIKIIEEHIDQNFEDNDNDDDDEEEEEEDSSFEEEEIEKKSGKNLDGNESFQSIEVESGEEVLVNDPQSSPILISKKKKKKTDRNAMLSSSIRTDNNNNNNTNNSNLELQLSNLRIQMLEMKRMYDYLLTQRESQEHRAARKIQFFCRRRLARKRSGFYEFRRKNKLDNNNNNDNNKTKRTNEEIIKFLWKEVKDLRKYKEREVFEKQNRAAVKIQKVWKGYVTRRWYRKLRIEYLKFKESFLLQKRDKLYRKN